MIRGFERQDQDLLKLIEEVQELKFFHVFHLIGLRTLLVRFRLQQAWRADRVFGKPTARLFLKWNHSRVGRIGFLKRQARLKRRKEEKKKRKKEKRTKEEKE